ncbi:MAG TPA: trehalase family glycosidase [Bryobacteraceae bacterium]|jgi:alpha,alpha-trehalase|nr:trehalase family glycosidase [Bryobacteraceae bacterium]
MQRPNHVVKRHFAINRVAAIVALAAISLAAQSPNPNYGSIFDYIRRTWTTLTRSNASIAKAAVDPKFKPLPNGRWPVYIASTEHQAAVEADLRAAMKPEDFGKIEIRSLPADPTTLETPGLLYLPKPYVVPGGRFNEMYGWDSYFIQLGLLRDGDLDLARDMADNFVYEIRNYGRILNANRTYYLSRSQPPFFTQMLLGVYQKTHDQQWLDNAATAIAPYYAFWTNEPHLTPETGLSRYYDLGDGPAPEVLSAERNEEGLNHYQLVAQYFKTHTFDDYDVNQYFDRKTDSVTPLFYKGDRSMRESGFDPSNRFGPFNIDIIHYDPVCLNTLLYLMEMQSAEILKDPVWRQRAEHRAAKINELMWDDRDGLYYDYNFVSKNVRRYPFLTTFYPMWAGIASKQQAARIVANLPKFERPGGLQTSIVVSGNQWDSPFGWAPLEYIAVEGLRKYGYNTEADRISLKWLSMIQRDFDVRGRIVEKYDVVSANSDVSAHIHFGYSSNEAGFGWTNAVYTTLYDELPEAKRRLLRRKPAA